MLAETFSRDLAETKQWPKPKLPNLLLGSQGLSIILLSVGYILPVYICVSTVQAPSNLMSAPACFWMPHSRPASSHWAPPHLYPSDGGGQRPRLVQSPTVVGLWATRILPIYPKHHQIWNHPMPKNLRTPL